MNFSELSDREKYMVRGYNRGDSLTVMAVHLGIHRDSLIRHVSNMRVAGIYIIKRAPTMSEACKPKRPWSAVKCVWDGLPTTIYSAERADAVAWAGKLGARVL